MLELHPSRFSACYSHLYLLRRNVDELTGRSMCELQMPVSSCPITSLLNNCFIECEAGNILGLWVFSTILFAFGNCWLLIFTRSATLLTTKYRLKKWDSGLYPHCQ